MKKLLYLIGSLLTLVLLATAGLALLLTTYSFEIDLTSKKEHLTQRLSDRTGLGISVAGDLRLKLGPRIGLRAEGLRILNPSRPGREELFAADTVAVAAKTLPLFSKRLELIGLELAGGQIRIERDSRGRLNWQTSGERETAPEVGEMDFAWLDVEGSDIRVRDSRLLYKDGGAGTSWEMSLKTADITPEGDALKVNLEGSVNGEPLRLSGTTASLTRLLEAGEPVPLDLSGNLLGLKLDVQGKVANPWSGAQVAAALRVTGESLAGLRPWIGKDLAGRGPVEARVELKGGGHSYRLAPFDLAVGKGRFDGSLNVDLSGKRPRLDLDLGIEEVDVRPLFTGGDEEAQDRSSGIPDDLFSTEPLPTEWLSAADLKAGIRVRNLITPHSKGRSLDLNASLASRRLEVTMKGTAVGDRRISADLAIEGNAKPLAVSLRIKADRMMLAPLLAPTQLDGLIQGDLDLSLKVQGSGGSADALMRSLGGEVVLLIEQGEADLSQLDRLTPGVRNLLGQLAQPKSELARLDCGVAAFEFQGGRTKVRVIVDSPDSTVVAEGDLDLGAETLEIRVVPHPKGVHLKVSAPVVVHGSLASPDYRVERGAVLASLTGLASKVAVPHLLLVDALGEAAAENACVKIATGKVEERAGEPLDLVTKPVEGVTKGAGAILKGTGAVLKGVGGAIGGVLGGSRQVGESEEGDDQPADRGMGSFESE